MSEIFKLGEIAEVNSKYGKFGSNRGMVIFIDKDGTFLLCFKDWSNGHGGGGRVKSYPYGDQFDNENCWWFDAKNLKKIENNPMAYIEEGNILITNKGDKLIVLTELEHIKGYLQPSPNCLLLGKFPKWIAINYWGSRSKINNNNLDNVIKILDKQGNLLWEKEEEKKIKVALVTAVHFGNSKEYSWLANWSEYGEIYIDDIIEVENLDSTTFVKVTDMDIIELTKEEIKKYKKFIKIIKSDE